MIPREGIVKYEPEIDGLYIFRIEKDACHPETSECILKKVSNGLGKDSMPMPNSLQAVNLK